MALDLYALGHRIHVLRKKRGLSQNALSEIIDKSPTYLSYIETGTKSMSLETFIDIVNALNTTADDLLQDSMTNTVIIMNHNFASVISDCSDYEQRVLLETVIAAKNALRSNKHLFLKKSR